MEWRPIPGWEGKYEVSEVGDVRSVSRGKIISFYLNRFGYRCCRLYRPKKSFRVHQVVALSFIPKPNGRVEINHKDLNRQNNHWSNLEWCTMHENLGHAFINGNWARPLFSIEQIREIRRLHDNRIYSIRSLAIKLDVARTTIDRVINGIGRTYSVVK